MLFIRVAIVLQSGRTDMSRCVLIIVVVISWSVTEVHVHDTCVDQVLNNTIKYTLFVEPDGCWYHLSGNVLFVKPPETVQLI